MRDVEKSDFEGKTVKSINTECVNVIEFTFTDNTTFKLFAECGSGYNNFPFFFIEEDKN